MHFFYTYKGKAIRQNTVILTLFIINGLIRTYAQYICIVKSENKTLNYYITCYFDFPYAVPAKLSCTGLVHTVDDRKSRSYKCLIFR